MDNLKDALIKTLYYASIFDYPLTQAQLWRFLIWKRKTRPSFSLFLKTVDWLSQKKQLFQIGGFYLIDNQPSWVKLRRQKENYARNKLKICWNTISFLRLIPTIELIGLTGKLALKIAEKDDDIDLLIITKSNALWLTRLLVISMLAFIGVKRQPCCKKAQNLICVNMFLDKDHMQISKDERDLYSAHEIVQLEPIYEKNNCYQDFLFRNQWVKDYLPNAIRDTKILGEKDIKRKNNLILLVSKYLSVLIFFLEQVSQKLQLWYMRKRRTREVIRKGYVRFHPQDARSWILLKYNEIVRKHVT